MTRTEKWDLAVPLGGILFIVLVLVGVCCSPSSPKRPSSPLPKFSVGDVIEVAQTNEKVTVLRCWNTYLGFQYECRVALPVTVTHVRLLSRDSEVSRYSTVWFREFELRRTE
jgi:hypothetical protein